MENLQGWRIPEGRMRSNARGMANQGNHYAKIAKSATFAQFVSDSLLELRGLMNPLKYYLERRSRCVDWNRRMRKTARTVV